MAAFLSSTAWLLAMQPLGFERRVWSCSERVDAMLFGAVAAALGGAADLVPTSWPVPINPVAA